MTPRPGLVDVPAKRGPASSREPAPHAVSGSGQPERQFAPQPASWAAPKSYLDDFEEFARTRSGEPRWLAALRREAIARFQALGFPTTKDEDWHFTSVSPIVEADFRYFADPGGATAPEDLAPFTFGQTDWPTLVFLNGRYAPDLSPPVGLPAGVRLLPLSEALSEEGRVTPHVVSGRLTKLAPFADAAFTALNTAFMADGAVVHVERDTAVEAPIHLIYLSDSSAAKSVMHPRTLLVLDRHASATVVESYVSIGDPSYFTNAVTEVALADGATLRHYKVQRESQRAFHVGTTSVHQARDSHYVSFSFASGAALSRTNIYTVLDGEGGGATLDGLYLGDGDQHVDHQTRIEHAQPNCFSREVYKGILDDSSHGVFNGKVYVHPIAQKTDGKQTNNTLLLSERARLDTKPQLEIFADDVKCTHGATVGRLDEVALYYMRSRGISHEHSRRLLTYAFAADVIEQIGTDPIRLGLEALTFDRFTKTDGGA